MAVDLEQFHQIFIEESVEGLDAMENALMELDVEDIDSEVINTIFRSAHSIKGGGGTFGFTALASFTHVLETLLDEVRSGKRGLTTDEVNLLLESIDCMRDMLDLIRAKRNEDTPAAIEVQKNLEAALGNYSSAPNDHDDCVAECNNIENSDVPGKWVIEFKPNADIIRSGNDPLRLIRELNSFSSACEVNFLGEIPALNNFLSEDCIFSWKITLTGSDIDEAKIIEVFEWVEDECELTISRHDSCSIESDQKNIWNIKFIPHPNLLQTGNEPLKIIKEIETIAVIDSCTINTQSLPSSKMVDCEKCYISWDLAISGDFEKHAIEEIFEWVVDDCDLVIEKIDLPQPAGRVDSEIIHDSNNTIGNKVSDKNISDKKISSVVPITGKAPTSLKASAAIKNEQETATSKPASKVQKKTAAVESSSIRVGIDKIDSLINMVGELVITQSMLGQLGADFDINSLPKLIEGLSQLEQNTRELQESVMRIRMLPISFAFSRFPRMVRDLGQKLDKKINLVLQGEGTELDKTVMEKIGDPLVHLVRNSIDHGIETSEDRIVAGKSETGTVTLNAYHQGGNVIIEIMDDGKGLDRQVITQKGLERGLINESDAAIYTDEQIFDLIFQPGFSTAAQVSDLSGRGVGMDVVKKNIQALNGIVEIQSKKGSGTKIKISLPLTLAILDGQLVRVANATYIFPLVSIVESMRYKEDLVNHIAGGCSVFKLREEYVPIVDLSQSFGGQPIENYSNALMVVVECDGFKVAMLVDELMAQQQVVIKSLEQNYQRVEGISGATILGDGTVALIVDVPGVVRLAGAEAIMQKHILPQSA